MATALCRGLQGGRFRAATFSSFTRWTNAKIPQNRRRINIQPASYFKTEDRSPGDLQEINKPSACSTAIKDVEKERPGHDNWQYSKENINPRIKRLPLLSRTHKTQLKRFPKTDKKTNKRYDDVESYNSLDDPRNFQQSRPEYKSLCYNSEPTMLLSAEEVETLLQKVASNDDFACTEISDLLEKLSGLPKDYISRQKLKNLCEKLCSGSVEKLQLFTHGELIRILAAFVRLKTTVQHPILKDYEKEFIRRACHLSTDELLLVADMWRYLSFSVPKYLEIMCSYLHVRCLNLSLAQAIQLIYIIGEGRNAPVDLMEKLEAVVLRDLQTINLDEIGTVCLAFFKTGHGLSEYLMIMFGDMIAENIDGVSNYSLVNVLKMFRFTRVYHKDFFRTVGQVAHKRIPEIGIQGIMHITLSFAALHILDENLMDTVALVIRDRASYCRSKDIAKFLWSFGTLAYNPQNADDFYSALINEVYKKWHEFEAFPEHFLTCLMGLAFCQRFPLNLIKIAFKEQFILESTKISIFELKKDLFTVAGSVEIECPEYTGETISPELRQEVTETLVKLSMQDIYNKEEAVKAALMLEILLGGPEFVKHHMILPHTRSKDVEVHFDVNNKPIPINADIVKVKQPNKKPNDVQVTDAFVSQLLNKKVSQSPEDTTNVLKTNSKLKSSAEITEDLFSQLTKARKPKKKPTTDIIKLAIQVTNRNQYIYGQKQLLGLHVMKRRQLQKLGYMVVELPYWEWYPLAKSSQSKKLIYLHDKLSEALKCTQGDG